MGRNSDILAGGYEPIMGFSSHLTSLVSSVVRALRGTRKINLTTPRIKVLEEIIIVSINRNPVRLMGPGVVTCDNGRRALRKYLSVPNG